MTINAWGSDNPAEVDKGGTGLAVTTAYGVMCGGTTTTAALQSIAVGSNPQVLTSNGASALPSMQAAGAGGVWTYLASTTISDDATIAFTGLEKGFDYLFTLYEIVPNTDNTQLELQVGTGVTPDWETTGSDYQSSLSNASAAVTFTTLNMGSASGEGLSGEVLVMEPGSASINTRVYGTITYTTALFSTEFISAGSGGYVQTTAVTAVRFKSSSGNLSTGVIKQFKRSLS